MGHWLIVISVVSLLGAGLVLWGAAGASAEEKSESVSPITAEIIGEGQKGFATFINRLHPDNRIGHRFHEHTPIVHGKGVRTNEEAGIDAAKVMLLEKMFADRAGVVKHRIEITSTSKGWVPQTWTFYLVPVEDGIDILFVIETGDEGLASYYGIQQCFRMSGKTNSEWRHKFAETPAFSEYDLWAEEKGKREKTSLTYVLREGKWEALPAGGGTVGARTPLGVRIDTKRAGRNLEAMSKVGPYKAKMLEPIDYGLITRRNKKGTWVSSIFWERTSHVTNHHPADCLHSIVNLGGIPPNSRRAIRGKIYWFKGTLDDLRQRWQRDFRPR